MTRNPFLNALAALGYIALIVVFLVSLSQLIPEPINPIAPMLGFLSLFVLSAAVTGYCILGMPLQLFLEGKKQEGIALFLKTLGVFALLALVLSGCILAFSL